MVEDDEWHHLCCFAFCFPRSFILSIRCDDVAIKCIFLLVIYLFLNMRMPPPRFTCWVCSFTSSTQTALTTHLRRAHNIRLNPPHRPHQGVSASIGTNGNGVACYPYPMRVPGAAVAAALGGGELVDGNGLPVGKAYNLHPNYVYQMNQLREAQGIAMPRTVYSCK